MPTLFSSSAQKVSRDALLAKADEPSVAVEAPVIEPEVSEPVPASTPASKNAEPVEELSPEVQQTFFAEDVVIQQMPHAKAVPKMETVQTPQPKWKAYAPLAAVLGGALLLVLGVGILLRPSNPNQMDVGVITDLQVQNTSELSVLQRELVLLEKDVEAADPLQAKLAFPPVNFSLKLEEATLLQQEGANRFR